jgi:hypothetical protein
MPLRRVPSFTNY